jgi:hypothetical protein
VRSRHFPEGHLDGLGENAACRDVIAKLLGDLEPSSSRFSDVVQSLLTRIALADTAGQRQNADGAVSVLEWFENNLAG